MQALAAESAANKMRRFLPGLGVCEQQASVLHNWLEATLDELEAHFSAWPYLLGGQCTIADFGLIGPLWAHMGRDPHSLRTFIAPRKHVASYVVRMANESGGAHPDPRPLSATTPPSLQCLLLRVAREFVPYITAASGMVREAYARALAEQACLAKTLPRALGNVTFPMGSASYTRQASSYTLWMVQRSLDLYRHMPAHAQALVRAWLAELLGADSILPDLAITAPETCTASAELSTLRKGGRGALELPRLTRVGLRVSFGDCKNDANGRVELEVAGLPSNPSRNNLHARHECSPAHAAGAEVTQMSRARAKL